jgi:hypothetical protein
MSILMYSHFHKSFPFNFESDWMTACYAGGLDPYKWMPPDEQGKYVNIGRPIQEFRHYYSYTSEDDFLRAMGQQATEYFLLENTPSVDFIGCTTYRRYLLLDRNTEKNVAKISMPATQQNAEKFGTQEQKEIALEYLQTADILTNHSIALPFSVEAQYLQSQPSLYWQMFKEAIHDLFPNYRQHLRWFTHNNIINYETCYIMRRDVFMRYADELFRILENIWKNCSSRDVYPTQQTTSEPFPWRYPGFLGERFMPFFVYANSLKKIQVPLVILE